MKINYIQFQVLGSHDLCVLTALGAIIRNGYILNQVKNTCTSKIKERSVDHASLDVCIGISAKFTRHVLLITIVNHTDFAIIIFLSFSIETMNNNRTVKSINGSDKVDFYLRLNFEPIINVHIIMF